MARFDVNISDDFLKALGKLADVDRVAEKMIDAALPTVEDIMEHDFNAVHHPYLTGTLARSFKGKISQDKNGNWYGLVRPTGKDSKGVRNAEKLAYYEYGTSKQRARPILDRIRNDAAGPTQDKMEQAFREAIK